MFGTDANFYKNRVLIEGAGQYKTNEILTAFLEYDFPDLRELLESCKNYERKLHYPETFDEVARFDGLVQRAITFFNRLDEMIDRLPPYRDRSLRSSPPPRIQRSFLHRPDFLRP